MKEIKIAPVEYCIFRYLLAREGQTVLIKDVASAIGIAYQTVSKYVNLRVNCGDIQRDGKKFTIINPYIREAINNG